MINKDIKVFLNLALNKVYLRILLLMFMGLLSLYVSAQIQLADSLILRTLGGKQLNKQESGYDHDSKEFSRLYSVWNQVTREWRPLMEYAYTYDVAGNIVSEEAFMMDSTTFAWNGIHKQVSEFDKKGREIRKFYYSWNQREGNWTANYRYEAELDKDGNKIEDMAYFGHQNQWAQYEYKKYEYKYDEAGNCIKMYVFDLNSKDIKSYMKPKQEYKYTYDGQGNLLSSSLYQAKDEYQWVPKNKYEYEYDSDGNRILETHFIGDEEYGDWNEHYKYGHTYDVGHLTSAYFYYWDKKNSGWIGKYNYLYEYDGTGKPILIKLHVWDNKSWLLNEIGTYYYPTEESPASDYAGAGKDQLLIYPNPAIGSFTVSGMENADMVIVDMQGRIVYTKKSLHKQEVVQVTSWTSGTYLVSITLNGERISRKVIASSNL